MPRINAKNKSSLRRAAQSALSLCEVLQNHHPLFRSSEKVLHSLFGDADDKGKLDEIHEKRAKQEEMTSVDHLEMHSGA